MSPTALGSGSGLAVNHNTIRHNLGLPGCNIAIANNRVTTVNAIDQREHTMMVADVSGSMGSILDAGVSKLDATINALTNMIINKHRIDATDEIGLVTFDSSATEVIPICPLDANKPMLIQAVQSLQACGGTDLNEGVTLAGQCFDWSHTDVVRRIVLLTDGEGGDPLRIGDTLKSKGVVIDVIGVGPTKKDVNEKLLRKLASVIDGETHYRFIKDHRTLIDHYTQLANKTATAV